MMTLVIPRQELWDESKNEFIETDEKTIVLEHSLVSIAKWESKYCKPFLGNYSKTFEETIDYIKCMTITQNVCDKTYNFLTSQNIEDVNRYIDSPMTATWFRENNKEPNKEVITNEKIYYWMITLQIPFECQKWHLNRLLTLIRVCNEENKPKKKLSPKELAIRNSELNAMRRSKFNSKG